ncbi:hypothetical protein [Nitrosophilus kaiyonis]|uniref:hypothetical protein n=1 Tax=Nitrosophilus kaiyonis TaxID=2930200 RepID=UPI0024927328|nr:hypothetical protein [Nitrosophilus kaiyonis]
MEEILVDTKDLEAPAPMQLVLSALQNVIEGQSYIHQIHRMSPDILLNKLSNMGYEYIIKKDKDEYHIYIFFPKDKQKVLEKIDNV